MPTDVLPTRLDPVTGEALRSYLTRLSHANDIPRGDLLDHERNVCLNPRDAAALATTTGLPIERIVAMTLDPYPPAVRGTGPTRRGGWRLHIDDWTCPRCTPATGVILRDWALALHPACRSCGVLLARGANAHPVNAGGQLLDLIGELLDLVAAAGADPRARAAVRRLRRLCVLVAQSIDGQWPDRPATAPNVDTDAARAWGRYPTQNPGTVAAILLAVAPTLSSTAAQRRLLTDGYTRLTKPMADLPQSYLPHRPAPRAAPAYCAADYARLGWLTTQLGALSSRYGLTPAHVPALASLPGEYPTPDRTTWPQRAGAAVALHMLLSRQHGDPCSDTRACHAFGRANYRGGPLADGIATNRGITAPNAELLHAVALHLVEEGLVDYQRRRDILRLQLRLPRRATARLRLPDADDVPGEILALGWIWVTLTCGLTDTGPFPLLPTGTVLAFGSTIDPEIRLALHEHATTVLADADDLGPTLTPFPVKPAVPAGTVGGRR